MLYSLLLGCAPISLDPGDDVAAAGDSLGQYELGWPIDACSAELDDAGTGHAEGDVLPQYTLEAQTGERVSLHDFCNRAVYIEFGYFT